MASVKNIEIKVDWYTRTCLTVIAGLLTLVVMGLWTDAAPGPKEAVAQKSAPTGFQDPSKQRQSQVKEMQKTNVKLDELVDLFRSGKAKVVVVEAKSSKGK